MKHIKHLVIKLKGTQDGGSIETVSGAVITALYNLSKDESLVYNEDDLVGDLLVSGTYQRYVTDLHTKYPNLNITALSYYMYFEDPVIEQYWANSIYGDGVGITATNAASVTSWPQRDTEYNSLIKSKLTSNNVVGSFAFAEDSTLTTFNELQNFNNLTTIPPYAFAGSNINLIDLTNITTLAPAVFKYCSQLTAVDLPNLLSFQTRDLAKYNILNTTLNNNHQYENTDGAQFRESGITTLNIGANVMSGLKIKTIPTRFCQDCSNLITITGLNEVTDILTYAFLNCSTLTSLPDLNTSINYIRDNAFLNNTNLLCIDITNVNILGNHTFNNCTNLIALDTNNIDNINISDEYTLLATSIGDNVFNKTNLFKKTINLPNITSLKGSIFNSTNIKKLNAPNCTSLSNNVFLSALQLEQIILGNVSSIGSYCIERCPLLTDVVFGELTLQYNSTLDLIDLTISSLTTLNTESFCTCPNLWTTKTIIIDDLEITKGVNLILPNLSIVNTSCFNNIGISGISIPNITTITANMFNNCNKLKYVNIPNATIIKNHVFESCTSLTSYTIPNTVTAIENSAFKNTGLTGPMIIPASVESIGQECFSQSPGITYYVMKGTTPPTLTSTSGVFMTHTNGTLTRPIYVPDSAVEDYKIAWSASAYYVDAIKPISELPS